MDYKDTLLMPKTDFPMRGNLGVREVAFQKRWEEINLYQKVLDKNKNQEPFILHDGPPYANGNIHIGHAFQKTLKDFVLRYQTMKGRYVPYIPGWDTHGLPIEVEVTKKVNRKEMSVGDFRKLCRKFALEQVDKQKEQFKRLGILGDWENPYLTLDKDFEADQLRIFGQMVKKNLIYRGLKPVYWSPSSESALAEAEIEYHDKQSKSIYISFDILSDDQFLNGSSLLIWTTTPWTLPANLAVSVHPKFIYSLIEVNKKKYILLQSLLEKVADLLSFKDYKTIKTYRGEELENVIYQHPLFSRTGKIVLGEHVTSEDGTGLVHTAPGHGEDDYKVGKEYNLDILAPVDEKGYMTLEAHQYANLFYEVANEKIVSDLKDNGHLLRVDTITHSYPHDWRTRKPIIFRATPQWFISMENLKENLLNEVNQISWVPEWGKVRMTNMLTNRDDWCISRQRTWGVPIPIFYTEDKTPILDENVIEHVATLFEQMGSDIWYEMEAKDLLPKGYKNPLSPNGIFYKELDIMDVWFDSGTSYSVLLRRGLKFPCDLYLEGADQFRGWFNSSLTTSVAINGKSPYKEVVTHGFVNDGQGRKMSKSLGNVIDPLKVINQQGADILRLWTATVDYHSDVRLSDESLAQVSEGYRKIRNTLKYMLGNLHDFDINNDYISFSMRGNLNRVMTLKYKNIQNEVIKAYESYRFYDVYRNVIPFIVNDLSAFYLDYAKDILYIEKAKSFERLSIQSTIYDILLGLLRILTPIIPHTTSEAYLEIPNKKEEDVYLEQMPEISPILMPELLETFLIFDDVRVAVLKQLELAREQKVIGKSLQALVNLKVTKKQKEAIDKLDLKLHQVLIVSKVNLEISDKLEVEVLEATGHVCDRCWNIVETVNDNGICERCEKVLKED
ncbi:isoleucine--tRNA ligase [Acholeplasma sp. OttesenSCG-928-E16]|nr:isoleucine--tRNA ligase [Acholeplasma sp. OttesenSCG-928-E16]